MVVRRGRPPTVGRETIAAAALDVVRERGVGRLTTREVAARAGVSEGTIFNHFGDRHGLLTAVFTETVRPVLDFSADLPTTHITQDRVVAVLTAFGSAAQTFLDGWLDAMFSAQGDVNLHHEVAQFMDTNDLGPHRGVRLLSDFFAAAQRDGVVASDLDPEVIAYTVISGSFLRSAQPRLMGHDRGIPSVEASVSTLMRMIAPRS